MTDSFKKNFVLLWFGSFFNFAGGGIFISIVPLYFNNRGLSYIEIGVASSIASLSMIIVPLLAGRLSDIWSRKKTAILCKSFSVALTPLYIFAGNFVSFIPLQLSVPAMFWTFESMTSAISLELSIEGKIGTNLGILRSSALGWSMGSISSGFLLQNFGFQISFITSAAFHLLSAISVLGLTEPKKGDLNLSKKKTQAFNIGKILPFLLIIVFIFSTMPAFHSFLPLFMKNELGAPESVIPLIFAITPVGEIPLTYIIGRLADKIDKRKLILICLLAFPVRWGAILLANNYVLIIPIQILHGLTFTSLYAAGIAYLSEIASTRSIGVIVGAFSSSLSIGNAMGAYLLGFTVEKFGFGTMYLQAIATSIICTVAFLILALKQKKR